MALASEVGGRLVELTFDVAQFGRLRVLALQELPRLLLASLPGRPETPHVVRDVVLLGLQPADAPERVLDVARHAVGSLLLETVAGTVQALRCRPRLAERRRIPVRRRSAHGLGSLTHLLRGLGEVGSSLLA